MSKVTGWISLFILGVSITIFAILIVKHEAPWFFIATYWGLNSFKNALEFDKNLHTDD